MSIRKEFEENGEVIPKKINLLISLTKTKRLLNLRKY